MDRGKATTYELSDCLAVLTTADKPLTAAEIAAKLGLAGCRETQRRRVRAFIKLLRDKGCQIIATQQDGYSVAKNDRMCWGYLDSRQIYAKRLLGVTHKRKRMLTTARGQGLLFGRRMMTGLG